MRSIVPTGALSSGGSGRAKLVSPLGTQKQRDDVGYEIVDDIEQLPRRLTSLYRVLSAD